MKPQTPFLTVYISQIPGVTSSFTPSLIHSFTHSFASTQWCFLVVGATATAVIGFIIGPAEREEGKRFRIQCPTDSVE